MAPGFVGAIVAIMLFLFGIVMGSGIGDRLAKKTVTTREYIVANLLTLLVGGVAIGVVLATGLVMVVCLVVGLIAGTVVGLKMGFGESVGPWKAHDRFFGINRDQLARAKNSKQAEAARRARRDGTPEPELISTITTDTHSSKE